MRSSSRHGLGYAVVAGLCALWGAASPALAYDLSRQGAGPDDGAAVFVDAQLGLWIPGPDTFSTNHNLSTVFGGELGIQVLSIQGHQLFVVLGGTFSPQALAEELIEEKTAMILAFGGVRYVPGTLCSGGGTGCPFLEVALGLTWDTAEEEPRHSAPKGELTVSAGIGYRVNFGRYFHGGVRIDLAYLEEDYTRQIGWFAPAVFLGAHM